MRDINLFVIINAELLLLILLLLLLLIC